MILQLFGFALLFLVLGIIAIIKKRKLLGWAAVLLAVMLAVVGAVVVVLYPQTLPF